MHVPLLDLKAQYATIRSEIEQAVGEVFESQHFIMGPKVREFEEAAARYVGVPHALGCASGTDAILLSLMAIGVGPGDEVITPSYTFFATGGSVARLGAKTVFCDIRPDTYNLNPELLERLITPRTKAIIPVHLFGLVAEMGAINAIAGAHGIPVVEDAAQAIGAASPWGNAGAMGEIGCFSFFPSKNLGGAGDGGMATTRSDELADLIGILRQHGARPKYHHSRVGINSRLDAIQAAVLTVKLRRLDTWTEKRRANADTYRRLFADRTIREAATPAAPEGYRHIYNQFVIRVRDRDRLRDHLAALDIGTEIYYPVPLHLQECFASLGYRKGDLPESEEAADSTLAIPIYPELSPEMQEYVADSIARFYGRG
jgi:dTDP-4-amino-4,6-dideoxygalactose transaminase